MVTENKRSIMLKESLEFLESKFEGFEYIGANWANHKKTRGMDDTYQITVDKISNKFISNLLLEEWVKDVFYHPSMAPTGYGIAMRYRLFISYNKVPLKRPRRTRRASKNAAKK